ncbi:hypothetical protein AB9R81_11705 [Vibrio cyclitrophicus]
MNKLVKHRLEISKKQAKSKWFKPETYTYLLNPIWQTFLWFGALLWGALASLFATDILDFTLPRTWEAFLHGSVHLPSTIFFATAFLLFLLFSLSRWVTTAQDRVVLDSMLTMPPHDFWAYFGKNYVLVSQLVDKNTAEGLSAAGEDVSDKSEEEIQKHNVNLDAIREDMNEAVRQILDATINLVKKWDASNLRSNSVVYRANVMTVTYFGTDDGQTPIESEKAETLNKLAMSYTIQPFGAHYSGFISLEDSTFTTTTETSQSTPDSRNPIAFPFTLKNNRLSSPVTSNLWGAPRAVVSGQPSYVSNVDEIPQKYLKEGGILDKKIHENLQKYYTDKSVAHSILSIPLHDGSNLETRYVLNIYRDQEGLLFDGSKVSDFTDIIRPYSTALGRLLQSIDLFDELRNQKTEPQNDEDDAV